MSKLKIEYVPIDSIKPYENNAKIHTREQIEQIKKSINEFSMNDPIGIWHNQIVEGHGRWIACKELGINTVPVIRLDDLTDEQRRAYMLVHNQLTMNTGFDNGVLDIELDDIHELDMSQFGFDDYEINDTNEEEIKEAKYNDNISVVVECGNENEAEKIYNNLIEEGYKCHISTL